jgi:hypothetical protein
MHIYSIAEAKAHFSELIAQAETGGSHYHASWPSRGENSANQPTAQANADRGA